jgi:plasmid stabilization system protein ParE
VKVRFGDAANSDLDAVKAYYEAERLGLGVEFAEELHAILRGVKAFPNAAPPVGKGVRVVRSRRFPYGVYYQVKGDEIIVIGIIHFSRRPGLWRKRFEP